MPNFLFKSIFLLLLLSFGVSIQAQSWDKNNTGKAILLNFGYGPQVPGGDLKARFGMDWAVEFSADLMTDKNWIYGLQGQYLFGTTVKQDVLAGLRTDQGDIIGNNRTIAKVSLRQRGGYVGLRIGRLIAISDKNTRSGIRINLGAGILQHWIRIQEDPFSVVPQLTGEYQKGYDRLTNGLALHQFIGYQILGKNNGINFTGGFEFFEGFTKNRRSFDFDTQMQDTASRFDILSGFRLSFTLPFYIGNADEIFY